MHPWEVTPSKVFKALIAASLRISHDHLSILNSDNVTAGKEGGSLNVHKKTRDSAKCADSVILELKPISVNAAIE